MFFAPWVRSCFNQPFRLANTLPQSGNLNIYCINCNINNNNIDDGVTWKKPHFGNFKHRRGHCILNITNTMKTNKCENSHLQNSEIEVHLPMSCSFCAHSLYNVKLKLFVSSRLCLVKCLIAVCRSSLHFYYFIREPIPTFFYNKTLNLMCIIYWNHK